MESLKTLEKQGARKPLQEIDVLTPAIEKFLHVDYTMVPGFSQEYTHSGMTIGISESLDEIAAIRPFWNQMRKQDSSNIPDADYNKYISTFNSKNGQIKPFVMYIKKDNTLLAMLIGKTQEQPLDLKLGYLTLLRPRLKCLTIIYGGIIGKPDENLCHILIDELTAQLRAQRADIILFHYLRTDSVLYSAIRSTQRYLFSQLKTDKHWRMIVPDTIDKFYLNHSRGHRHNLRRAISRFEQSYAGDIRYVNYTNEDEVDDFLETAAHISKKTYQYALNAGLVNDESTRARIMADAAMGWFRGHIVFAGKQPCAFLLGLHYENVYYMVNMGYDPVFKSNNPGLILFLKVLEGLCNEPSVEMLDFYFGDAEYKNRYGTEYWQEANICMFAPRIYPMFINALQVTTMSINAVLRCITNKIGFTNQIKKTWRNLLSEKAAVRNKKLSTGRV